MHPRSVCPIAILQWTVPAPPCRDAGERLTFLACGPVVEHDRLRRCLPGSTAQRHLTIRLPDVLSDRHEIVVPGQHIRQSQFLPDLAVAGVDVEKYSALRRGKE